MLHSCPAIVQPNSPGDSLKLECFLEALSEHIVWVDVLMVRIKSVNFYSYQHILEFIWEN